jgi:hypothetical protein
MCTAEEEIRLLRLQVQTRSACWLNSDRASRLADVLEAAMLELKQLRQSCVICGPVQVCQRCKDAGLDMDEPSELQ